MNQLLDICLTLTPPPAERCAGTIAHVELRCDELGLSQPVNLQPLNDPFTPQERDELVWYLEHYWQWPYEEFARRGQQVEQLLTDVGKRLYAAVFGAPQAQGIVQPWRLQPNARRQLSLIGAVPAALSLPWELLHDEQGFLALRAQQPVSIVRRLPQAELGALLTEFTPPLRVLLVTARPDDAGFVDPRGIARELLDEVQPQIEAGAVALEFLRPPTLTALRERLGQQPPIHILHFDGHGTFDDAPAPTDGQRLQGGAQGKLAFEDDEGKCDLVEAERLAQLLQDSGVRLAVLTACQSAQGAADDLFSSVAARLIRSGVDAVVAMSASVLVASAAKYVEAFYRRLAAGEAVTLAHERARQALHDNPERHLHQRRRDEAGTAVRLKGWWLPHFYQQRAVNFVVGQTVSLPSRSGATSGSADASIAAAQTDSLRYTLPPAPRYGFTGRARELHRIERWLLRGSAVVVHGFGGTGKTAIAREAADWLTRTGMYTAACFVSFEHGGDAASLLSSLGARLGVNTGDYDPRNANAALATLRRQVRSPGFSRNPGNASLPPEGGTTNSVLVIADNLESILPGGDAPLDAAARAQLWDVLSQLSKAGAGVIITSRNAEFGDAPTDLKMAHGKEVKHLELGGLHPEDAYALAVQLFKDLDIPQSRAPYPKLRDLLVQLDHHPLAIQLVLPALGEAGMTIDRLSTEFAALLHRFTDDRETGRNRSLSASLEYSLRRLGKWHQQIAVRLAPFEGGASATNCAAG